MLCLVPFWVTKSVLFPSLDKKDSIHVVNASYLTAMGIHLTLDILYGPSSLLKGSPAGWSVGRGFGVWESVLDPASPLAGYELGGCAHCPHIARLQNLRGTW